MKSYFLDLFGYRYLDHQKKYFNDPILELRAIDPSIRIITGIKLDYGYYINDCLEVAIENNKQEEYVKKYIELRKDKLDAWIVTNERERYPVFDYHKAREVGHIPFWALSVTKQKHPELFKISNGHFQFIQEKLE